MSANLQSTAELSPKHGVVQSIHKPHPEKPLPKWAKVTDNSLVIEKQDLTYDEWAELFRELVSRDKKRQWVIGDALVEAETRFGDDVWAQEIDPEEESEKEEEGGESYRQYMQVSSRIPAGSRLPKLSWGHHQAVAYLPAERRDYWLQKALTDGLKRQDLRRAARKEKRQEEKKNKRVPKVNELELIHSEEAQEYFDRYLEALTIFEENIPKGLPSARMMNHAQQGQVRWQRNRTIETDCRAILEMFEGKEGSEGVYNATDSDISVWLNRNSYFMGDYDLDDRLAYLVDNEMLQIVSVEDSRQEGRKGVMLDLYQLHPKYVHKMQN